jgi:uncharacterized protein YecT (DUF1311 family)
MTQKLFIFHFYFIFPLLTFGQDIKEQKNPIDIRLEHCLSLDSNMTTIGMNECTRLATEEWEKELNKYYKLLFNCLSNDEKVKLKEAQRQWLMYREKEIAFSIEMYGNKDGTMWTNVSSARILEIVKQRTIELKEYFELQKY